MLIPPFPFLPLCVLGVAHTLVINSLNPESPFLPRFPSKALGGWEIEPTTLLRLLGTFLDTDNHFGNWSFSTLFLLGSFYNSVEWLSFFVKMKADCMLNSMVDGWFQLLDITLHINPIETRMFTSFP